MSKLDKVKSSYDLRRCKERKETEAKRIAELAAQEVELDIEAPMAPSTAGTEVDESIARALMSSSNRIFFAHP